MLALRNVCTTCRQPVMLRRLLDAVRRPSLRCRGASPSCEVPRRNQARIEREGPTERRSSRRTENDAAGISSCGNRRQVLTPFERVQAHRRRVRYRFPSVGEFVARRGRVFEGGVVRASIGADRPRRTVAAGPRKGASVRTRSLAPSNCRSQRLRGMAAVGPNSDRMSTSAK
jgi:hypothetical protein